MAPAASRAGFVYPKQCNAKSAHTWARRAPGGPVGPPQACVLPSAEALTLLLTSADAPSQTDQ